MQGTNIWIIFTCKRKIGHLAKKEEGGSLLEAGLPIFAKLKAHMKQKHKMRLFTPDTSLSNPDPPSNLLTPPSIIVACLGN